MSAQCLPVVGFQVADDDAVDVERRRRQDAPRERIEHARRVVPHESGAFDAGAEPRRAHHVRVRLSRLEPHVTFLKENKKVSCFEA